MQASLGMISTFAVPQAGQVIVDWRIIGAAQA